ncbi:MAG TPA: elongation factor P maturation arginine rhamnosyltransferase EarP [Casimicrobiaceae bacterium]
MKRWDIFCSVVDNYGDVGVALRLARQLATEHAIAPRLYIDDRAQMLRMAPDGASGLDVLDWKGAAGPWRADAAHAPADSVVEAFGCGLPAAYLDAMQAKPMPPPWINLEYLSAEPWVDDHHGLASPQPQRPLTRHFFFPGFTADSGGLLRERGLLADRDAFVADASARAALWRFLGIDPPHPRALLVSLFCYPTPALPALLDAWSNGNAPVACIVAEGVAERAIDAWAGAPLHLPGAACQRGQLVVSRAHFSSQNTYDRLLWACDFNVVRGEDSFVRALWAARPMVWHAYVQAGGAHLAKLDAFLARYEQGLPADVSFVNRTFAGAWNRDDGTAVAAAWPAMQASLPALSAHARQWASELGAQTDLATRLVRFVQKLV